MVGTETSHVKKNKVVQKWYLVDARDRILGRLASKVATVLMGKDKPTWSPHLDTGDFVVIINADKIRVTGKKLADKKYYRHSGYLGGLKEETLFSLLRRRPERVVELAVKGMVPKGKLGRKIFGKLKVYAGPEHPHQAQKPVPLEV